MTISIEDMILELQDMNTFIHAIEMGCGAPFVNLLCSIEGASNIFHGGESPYSKAYIREKFDIKKNERFVSKSTIEKILLAFDVNKVEPNLVVATSFQLGNETRSTHGYVGIKDPFGIWIYHVSIHEKLNRAEQMKKIGETIVRLVYDYCCGPVPLPYVDYMWNRGKEQLSWLLSGLPDDETTTAFIIEPENGSIKRLEDLLRSNQKGLILYKGSFNPLTNAHVEILKKTEELYPGYTSVFCVSTVTYGKYFSTKEDVERIESLLSYGKPVLITNQARFGVLSKIIQGKYKGDLVFPMGFDTFSRLCKCNSVFSDAVEASHGSGFSGETIVNVFRDVNANMIVFGRNANSGQQNLPLDQKYKDLFIRFKPTINQTSSTEVRSLIKKSKDYSHLVPESLIISPEYEKVLATRS